MKKHYDVIIAGGGIIGCSIAYYLSKHTPYRVLIIEKNRIGSEASSAAAGMLGAQAELNEPGPLYDMARESRSMFSSLSMELKETSGMDIELINKGLLKVASEEADAERLQNLAAFHKSHGQQAQWVSQKDLMKMEPHLSGDLSGAMYLPDDGQVSAPQLTRAFAQSAVGLGADLLEFTEVERFALGEGGTEVVTSSESFYSENVVMASGVWTGKLAAQTGLHLPLFPVKGECLSLKYSNPPLTSTVISGDCYLVPKQGGRLVVGATMQANTYDRKVRAKGIMALLSHAAKIMPEITLGEWEQAWTGFRPQTPDGLPYMGRHPEIQGIYFAAGHFRNGILLSPLTGKWMADLIEGSGPEERLKAFAPERFANEKVKG